jgi:hypothetical protein
MRDEKTLLVVRTLLFRLLPQGPNAAQEAAAERISDAYVDRHGPIRAGDDSTEVVSRLRSLTLLDSARQLKEAVHGRN